MNLEKRSPDGELLAESPVLGEPGLSCDVAGSCLALAMLVETVAARGEGRIQTTAFPDGLLLLQSPLLCPHVVNGLLIPPLLHWLRMSLPRQSPWWPLWARGPPFPSAALNHSDIAVPLCRGAFGDAGSSRLVTSILETISVRSFIS